MIADSQLRVLLDARSSGTGGISQFAQDIEGILRCALPASRFAVAAWRPACSGGRTLRVLQQQVALPRVSRGFDVLHLTDFRPAALSTIPFILTIHDVFFVDNPDWYPAAVRRYKQLMLRTSLLKSPLAIVCVSNYTRTRLLHLFPDVVERVPLVRTIFPTVPPVVSTNADARTCEKPKPYFLTVSTIEPRKNHATVLRALRKLRGGGVDVRWKVVGAPGYGAARIIRQLVEEDGVDYLGHVPDAQRDQLYRDASFVAVPSLAEGFGYPPLEAMRHGVPVVSSTGSGLDETVGDAGIRVDPTDTLAWADAFVRVLNPAVRAHLIAQGSQQVRRFDASHAARAYGDLYGEVADQHSVLRRKQRVAHKVFTKGEGSARCAATSTRAGGDRS